MSRHTKSTKPPATSRQRVLEYLQAHRAVTIAELCSALHMTEANTRHHLAILEELGLAASVGRRPTGGRGRPARLFGPAERLLGDNLAALAGALLTELGLREAEAPGGLAQRLARQMASGMVGQKNTGGAGGLSGRIRSAVEQLNGCSYQARWEAHTSGPRLILGHCPYRVLLDGHPELCQVDCALLELLLGRQVEQLARLAPAADGLAQCVFRVRA